MIDPIGHALYRIRSSPVLTYPFPHFYATNVFPHHFYWDTLLNSLPATYEPMSYKHRAASNDVPACVSEMGSQQFAYGILQHFEKHFFERFPMGGRPRFTGELRFIRDEEGYGIGPHTDAPHKVVSLLFYLPNSTEFLDCGTSIFVSDNGKTCPGGPHHPFSGFREVWRAPFSPNSCLGFFKTPNSWHGVFPIERKIQRDVLLFNIYTVDEREQSEIQANGA